MALPAITRDCIPGFHRNSRKTKKLPPCWEMRPDSPALHADQCLFPNQTGKEPWFSWRNYRETPEIPDMSRRTLMSPQECEIARCTQIKLKWRPVILHWLQSNARLQSYRRNGLASFGQLQRFTETPVSSLREHEFQHRNSSNAPCIPYCLKKRADSQDSIKEVAHLPTSTSKGAFPQLSVCERDPEFVASRTVDSESPWLEKSRILLQWLECRLLFHLTR